MNIQRETYAQIAPDMRALIEDHWREIAHYQDKVALDPDWEGYQHLEENGTLIIVAARDAGRLVGYSIFLICRHLHYKQCVVAMNDVLYLKPEYRGKMVGARLIAESEAIVKAAGAHRITWHIKPAHDFSALLARRGYNHEELVMGKLLGD